MQEVKNALVVFFGAVALSGLLFSPFLVDIWASIDLSVWPLWIARVVAVVAIPFTGWMALDAAKRWVRGA